MHATDAIIPRSEVIRRTGRPDSSLRRDIKLGEFPAFVNTGPGRRGIPESELAIIMAARVAGASRDELRALVAQIHDQRRCLAVELGLEGAL